jgi:SNF2 family DNA or RNA helicase
MPELRPYQNDDVLQLLKHHTAGLFNEQRTGKTPTALKTLEARGCQRILIVCPASAIYQWKEEYETWLNKPCAAVAGTKLQKEKQLKEWKSGLVISYDSLKETSKSSGFLGDILNGEPDGVILDEAHRIKEPKTATAKAAFKLMKVPYRLALTGTPAPNYPYEIWSILYFLFPEFTKSYWGFIKNYFNTNTQYAGTHTYQQITGFKNRAKETELQIFLNEHCVQRKRKEVMAWLPEKDKQRIMLPASKEQQKYLNELEKYFETENIITQGTLDRLVRYRQICLHPQLLDLKGSSPKLDWVLQYLQDYPEEPTIIFSKFTSFLNILSPQIKQPHGLMVGATSIEHRNQLKNNFQSGKIKLLLINIDVGKEALTLDTATTMIFTDKYPPVVDIQQAEDRFVATTEDKKDKPHRIYELVIKDTYDEMLYALLDRNAKW